MDAFILAGAYLLDLILGDPKQWPHPVKLMGWIIEKAEDPLRKRLKEEIAGGVLVFGLAALTFLVTFLICSFSFRLNRFFGLGVSVFLGYTTISVRSLIESAADVKRELLRRNLGRARIKLSCIVGRDTNKLSEDGVIRAAVETVSENTTDGIISPLFYLALGGAPLAMAYKAVNTLDSMIGYLDERYIRFGRIAAITDEVANFVPARISASGLALSAWFSGLGARAGFRFISKYALKPDAANSTLTEGTSAAALGVQLGGVSYYRGKEVVKPYLGEDKRPLEIDDISRISRLAFLTGLIFVVIVLLIKAIF